ncbi:hypothetical protein D9M71_479300 [compost metagenome]
MDIEARCTGRISVALIFAAALYYQVSGVVESFAGFELLPAVVPWSVPETIPLLVLLVVADGISSSYYRSSRSEFDLTSTGMYSIVDAGWMTTLFSTSSASRLQGLNLNEGD